MRIAADGFRKTGLDDKNVSSEQERRITRTEDFCKVVNESQEELLTRKMERRRFHWTVKHHDRKLNMILR